MLGSVSRSSSAVTRQARLSPGQPECSCRRSAVSMGGGTALYSLPGCQTREVWAQAYLILQRVSRPSAFPLPSPSLSTETPPMDSKPLWAAATCPHLPTLSLAPKNCFPSFPAPLCPLHPLSPPENRGSVLPFQLLKIIYFCRRGSLSYTHHRLLLRLPIDKPVW